MPEYKILLLIALSVIIFKIWNLKYSLPYFLEFITLLIVFEIPLSIVSEKYTGSNYLALNYSSKLCVYYYLIVFIIYFKKKQWIKLYLLLVSMYIVVTQIYYFIELPWDYADGLSYNIGMALLFPLILNYLYDVIYTQSYLNIYRDPYFYLSFGILLFYTSAFPILTFINKLITVNPAYKAYGQLIDLGNIFLSLAYLGVALCSKTHKPSIVLS